jgi:hypothetical protein
MGRFLSLARGGADYINPCGNIIPTVLASSDRFSLYFSLFAGNLLSLGYAVSLPTSAEAEESINAETSALEQLDAAV